MILLGRGHIVFDQGRVATKFMLYTRRGETAEDISVILILFCRACRDVLVD